MGSLLRNRLGVASAVVDIWGANSLPDDSRLKPADVGPGVVGLPSSSRSGVGFVTIRDSDSPGWASSGVSGLPRLLY